MRVRYDEARNAKPWVPFPSMSNLQAATSDDTHRPPFLPTLGTKLVFDISHLPQPLGRMRAFKALNQAYVVFHVDFVQFRLSNKNEGVVQSDLTLRIPCMARQC